MIEDIINVIFLALICIVISSIIYRITPLDTMLLVPTCAIISIVLWWSYDYMLNKDIKPIESDIQMQSIDEIMEEINNDNNADTDTDLNDIDENLEDYIVDSDSFQNAPKKHTVNKTIPLTKQHPNEYDLEIYSGEDDIRKLYTHMGSNGDTQICNRMKYMSVQPRLSKDIRASYNKYTIEPYFQEELNEQENKIWWEMDMLDIHT